jgi:hypothetical protein
MVVLWEHICKWLGEGRSLGSGGWRLGIAYEPTTSFGLPVLRWVRLLSTAHVEAGVVEACVVVDDVVLFILAFFFLLHRWGGVGDVDLACWNIC